MPKWKARKWKLRRWKLRKLSWKQAVVMVVALLVVFSFGRALVSGFGKGAVDVTGQGGNTGVQTQSAKPQRTVEIDGKGVPINGGPVAVLNPGLARPGGTVAVSASGFDAGATVQVLLTSAPNAKPALVATAKADKSGGVSTEFAVPADAANSAPTQIVTVQQAKSDKVAKAELAAQAGVGTLKLKDKIGAPGATIAIDAEGFLPGEQVNVYWGRAGGEPAATLKADQAGRVPKAQVRVGVAPAGESTLVMIGDKSKTTATSPFTMLGLYPSAKTSPYAVKPGDSIAISGKGFAPGERVLVHFNESAGAPPIVMQSDAMGAVSGTGFKVPFGLKGSHTLVFTGEQSRASVSTGFSVLPFSPTGRASTYGGLPGTTLNFYARDFAPNEVVKVYVGGSGGAAGEMVAAFRVDAKGAATAAGSYVIPGNAQGKLTFNMVGSKSEASTAVNVTVDKADGPVSVAPQPKYTLPPELND
jgi:hypothetical protein